MTNITLGAELTQQLFEIRRHLHQNPELSFEEFQTAEYISLCLDKWGIPYKRMNHTGIIVDIVGSKPGPAIGIRADIDALPIQEETNIAFSSRNEGIMHACGHDGHTTILLGTVFMLNQLKEELGGTVRCIFQPGEEKDGSARELIRNGVLKSPTIEALLALHLWPHLPLKSVGIRYGCITASSDDFIVDLIGKSGHGGRPHNGLDAIAMAAQVIQSLQFMITKQNDPVSPVVINIGKINGGIASNVIPEKVTLEGTIRTTSPITRKKVLSQFTEIVSAIPTIYGGQSTIQFVGENPPILNNEVITAAVEHAAVSVVGKENVFLLQDPSMGADDFGSFAEIVPSCYFRLGIMEENHPTFDLHHPNFYFNQEVIPTGVEVFTQIILNWLNKGEK
jgi:amidohydrolase